MCRAEYHDDKQIFSETVEKGLLRTLSNIKVERFTKTFNGLTPLNILRKSSNLEVWQGFEYTSGWSFILYSSLSLSLSPPHRHLRKKVKAHLLYLHFRSPCQSKHSTCKNWNNFPKLQKRLPLHIFNTSHCHSNLNQSSHKNAFIWAN